MDFTPSTRSTELLERLRDFDEQVVRPQEATYRKQRSDSGDIRFAPPVMEDLKTEARTRGLWNLFMPDAEYGAGLSNVDYAPLCEQMGSSPLLGESTNCSAPDTGNMEILAQFGTETQREQWLRPLLEGEIRSCFAMTEPWVASSDASNIASRIERDGDHYVINADKWFTSGALDPRCKVAVLMGVTNPDADPYHRQSMILVPLDTPGVTLVRGLPVFGHDEGPGHAETLFENVRVPKENLLGEEGGGFAIAQARLGPGRIHHCMRAVGLAERALVAHVHARADAQAVRPLPRRAGCGAGTDRRVAHPDRTGPPAHDEGRVVDGHRGQEGGALRDRGDQGDRRARRHRRDRPRHPAVRRRRRHRRLAARVDVRARAHAASGRRSRRGAHAADRAPRAASLRDLPAELMRVHG